MADLILLIFPGIHEIQIIPIEIFLHLVEDSEDVVLVKVDQDQYAVTNTAIKEELITTKQETLPELGVLLEIATNLIRNQWTITAVVT